LYDEKLYHIFEKYLTSCERKRTKHEDTSSHGHEIILFGYRRGGHEFVKAFRKMKKNFAVVDYDPEVIDTLENKDIPYIYGDITDIELLEEIGVHNLKLLVSVVTDFETNKFILQTVESANPNCVVICHADDIVQAARLYSMGAGYVMLPHYIGSEKISNFIQKSGLKKTEFKKYRQKHISYLQTHFQDGDKD